jgi:predicted Zn-dependent protease
LAESPLGLVWHGFYLDGRSAARRAATIRLSRTALEASIDGGTTILWPYEDIRLARRDQAEEPVRIEHGDGIPETLIVPDARILESLGDVAGTGRGRIARARRRSPLVVVGALVGVVLAMLALYRWGIPALAHVVARNLPIAWEERMGAGIADHLAPPERRCHRADGQRALERLLARLTSAEASPYTFTIAVLDARTVNAFAAPGGSVVVLRGLIERARTPDELAGVLAHEVEHVLHRHATRMLIERASTGLLVGVLVGDVSGIIAFAAENASALSYSRQHEDEADADGLRLLVAAGIDPRGMISFYERLASDEGRTPQGFTYFSTHPAIGDRVTRLRQLASERAATPTTPALSDENWSALRLICG